jgi:hypothetical protein
MRKQRNACRVLVEKSEGKSLRGRQRHKWQKNIRVDFREMGWSGLICLRIGTRGRSGNEITDSI